MKIWKLCKYWKQAISRDDISNVVISMDTVIPLESQYFPDGGIENSRENTNKIEKFWENFKTFKGIIRRLKKLT